MIRTTRMRRFVRGVFLGWWVVAGGVGLMVLSAGLFMQSYGTYVVVFRETFGWSATALAFGFSLQQIESGLLGPLQGWLLEHYGSRRVMRAGVVIFGLGLMLFSQINSLATLYAAILVMAVGASLMGFLSITATVVNWFEKRRSTALALMQAGISIGGLLVPLVAFAIEGIGWRVTAFGSGIVVLLAGLPLTQVIRTHPEQYGLLPDGVKHVPGEDEGGLGVGAPRYEFTLRQALKTRAFWLVSFGHALALTVVSAVIVHLVTHLNEGVGYSVQAAASVVALMTAMTFVGQLAGGFLGDRYSKRAIAALAMLGHASGLIALAFAESLPLIIFFALLHGISWGMRGPNMSAIRADYFGRRAFATIMGTSSLIIMLGMVAGPVIAGVIADTLGSYQLGFLILAGLAAIGSLLFAFAAPPQPPR